MKYQGITTIAYSFVDNRMATALVSYDAQNNIVRTVTHNGPRYIYKAIPGPREHTVTFVGQSDMQLTLPWTELGVVREK